MKKLTLSFVMLLGLMVVFAGCDKAKEVADKAKDKAADMADIDFGDFDMTGMKDKISGITDGFKDVTADNVGGLTSKITELTGSMDGMGIDKLTGPAKTAVTGAMSKFADTIKSAMSGITDEGILSKLKPVVDALLEKVKTFM